MKIVSRIAELEHCAGVLTGLVPTMGGFHEGHLQLMRECRKECEKVVVSLFVNPKQFGAGEDFERYPRNLDRDAELASGVGVDVLFVPTVEEIYPRAGATVHIPGISSLWEGHFRPGHFDGVATVVCKLFNIVRPDLAYFGLKDLQQCIVISHMVADLNMPLRLNLRPTVRESDGLAMSTRNLYLTAEERAIAPSIYRNLESCKQTLLSGDCSGDCIEELLRSSKEALEDDGFRVDYFELIDLETAKSTRRPIEKRALIAAARLGKTRLIDNVLICPDSKCAFS